MPIIFIDSVDTPEGSSFPILKLPENKTQGIGYGETLDAIINNTSVSKRCIGFLGITNAAPVSIYKFTGSLDGWTDTSFWVELGASTDAPTASQQYVDVLQANYNPFGLYDGGSSTEVDMSTIPTTAQLEFTSFNRLSAYDINRAVNPTYLSGSSFWTQYWKRLNGPLANLDGSTLLTKASFIGQINIGYEYYIPDFPGFNTEDYASANIGNWTQGNNPAITDYLLSIPEADRPYIYHLAFLSDTQGNAEVYKGYNNPSDFSDSAWITAGNWINLSTNFATENHVTVYINDIITGNLPGTYPVQGVESWRSMPDVESVADLDLARLFVSMASPMRSHLSNLNTSPNSPYKASGNDITITLKTHIQV